MFKALATLCAALTIGTFVMNVTSSPSVAAATTTINNTTSKVQAAALQSTQKASALGSAITNNEPVPDKLRDFARSTERLNSLRAQLDQDFQAFTKTAAEAIVKFDAEATHIQDPSLAHNMSVLRRKTWEEQQDLARNVNDTITLLDNVLAKGADLQRAANCVVIASDMHNKSDRMSREAQEAKASATEYETTTTALVNKISNAFQLAKN